MGYAYKQWVGVFYPAGMNARSYLAHYSHFFDAVEMDSTFYGAPRPQQVKRWATTTPPDFTICPKTPRAITHDAPPDRGIAAMHEFVETVSLLGSKLGPILIQFGPGFGYGLVHRLEPFLAALPASARYAVEFRHTSWDRPETAALLAQHNVCWVAADYIHLPKTITRTTDFLYLRFIGRHGQYETKDRELTDKTAVLQQWHGQIQEHAAEVTAVYGFFNNDYAGHSPATCNRFKRIIGLDAPDTRPPQQGRLF